jgi:VanZ family protein
MGNWLRDSKVRVRILWGLWFLYVVAWTTALLTPHPVHIANALLPAGSHFLPAKTLHVLAYLVLTVLTLRLPARRSVRCVLLACVSAHAMATEFLQQFVPLRNGSLHDVGLDHIGIALGLAFVGIWRWWRSCGQLARAADAALGSHQPEESRDEAGLKPARSATKGGPC